MVISMRVRVYVSLKPTVLDPQGKTIRAALNGLGYKSVADVRQGKFFEISVDPQADPSSVRKEVEQIAQDVLANPVIEEYRVEYLD
jgi:phosphoribosylformylglycinamidine synthase